MLVVTMLDFIVVKLVAVIVVAAVVMAAVVLGGGEHGPGTQSLVDLLIEQTISSEIFPRNPD